MWLWAGITAYMISLKIICLFTGSAILFFTVCSSLPAFHSTQCNTCLILLCLFIYCGWSFSKSPSKHNRVLQESAACVNNEHTFLINCQAQRQTMVLNAGTDYWNNRFPFSFFFATRAQVFFAFKVLQVLETCWVGASSVNVYLYQNIFTVLFTSFRVDEGCVCVWAVSLCNHHPFWHLHTFFIDILSSHEPNTGKKNMKESGLRFTYQKTSHFKMFHFRIVGNPFILQLFFLQQKKSVSVT